MSWCFEDEASAATDRLLDALKTGEAIVPPLWLLEVCNVLLVAERRKRLHAAESMRFMALLLSLPIAVDQETPREAFGALCALAREHTLSSYDAAYLALAIRKGIAFATIDKRLRHVAKKLDIALII